jgi:hypothetical protein
VGECEKALEYIQGWKCKLPNGEHEIPAASSILIDNAFAAIQKAKENKQ